MNEQRAREMIAKIGEWLEAGAPGTTSKSPVWQKHDVTVHGDTEPRHRNIRVEVTMDKDDVARELCDVLLDKSGAEPYMGGKCAYCGD